MQCETSNNARDFALFPTEHEQITAHADGLDPLPASFADDETGRGNAVKVKLRLALPGGLMNAHEAEAFEPGLNKVAKDVRRQVLEHKDHPGRDRRQRGRADREDAP